MVSLARDEPSVARNVSNGQNQEGTDIFGLNRLCLLQSAYRASKLVQGQGVLRGANRLGVYF